MPTPRLLLAALSGAFASLFLAPAALAQGALAPPGAPAPTMKSLDQLEARKPLGTPNVVTTSTIVISEPGSYVLVGPITVASGNGITINESNVTLDLNGFTISSASPTDDASSAIKINGDGTNVTNISISNGSIFGAYTVASDGTGSGAGFTNGIYCYLPDASNVSASRISVRGVRSSGIYLFNLIDGGFGNITGCECSHVGAHGLLAASVEQCRVTDVASHGAGIQARNVANCNVIAPRANTAIRASTVSNSTGDAKSYGISAVSVSNCFGTAFDIANIAVGIRADIVTTSTGFGKVGISATSAVTNSRGIVSDNGIGDRTGISCSEGTVSFSRGEASAGGNNRSIIAAIAVACTKPAGAAPIQSPSLQLGTAP